MLLNIFTSYILHSDATVDYLGSCIDSTQCDSTKNLTCTNSICTCDSVKVGEFPFWSTTQQKCCKYIKKNNNLQLPRINSYEILSFSVSCPVSAGWIQNTSISSPCYKIFSTTQTWLTAQTQCQQTVGANLFSASSETKFEYLTTILSSNPNTNLWVSK